jgi:3-isopropylmalate dehydrogenase
MINLGTILSAAMLLEYSLGMPAEARLIEEAVKYVLDVEKLRTRDLGGKCSTVEMGNAINARLEKLLAL